MLLIDEKMGAKLRAEVFRVLANENDILHTSVARSDSLAALNHLLSKCEDIAKIGYAIGYREGERRKGSWECGARRQGSTPDSPAECDWPECGCDPQANEAMERVAEKATEFTQARLDEAMEVVSLAAGDANNYVRAMDLAKRLIAKWNP